MPHAYVRLVLFAWSPGFCWFAVVMLWGMLKGVRKSPKVLTTNVGVMPLMVVVL